MIVPLLLAAWLAQAEPAPPEPAPPEPAQGNPAARPARTQPAPPEPAQVNPAARPPPAEPAPAEAAPVVPTSGGAVAPPATPAATPAPSPSPSSAGGPPPPAPSTANTVSLLGGLAVRIGSAADALGPTVGFSLGGSFQRRYAALSSLVELGWAADFLFDRFSTAVQGSALVAPGVEQTYTSTRTVTETTFGALQTLDARPGPFRFWMGAGGGLAVGFFSSPELALRPGNATAYQPYARGVVGADIVVNDQTALGFRAGYTFMLTSSSFTTSTGNTIALFGDLLDIHAGLFYRFR